jgi:type III secretion protein N (ATPase)
VNKYASSIKTPAFEGATIQSARRARIKSRLPDFIADLGSRVATFEPFHLTGRVRKVVGTIIHAAVPDVQVGEIVELYTRSNGSSLLAECVGFLQEEALLSPIGETQGVSPRTEVRRTGRVQSIAVGPGLKGRVLDGLGNFIDGRTDDFDPEAWYPVHKDPPDPMKRRVIDKPLPTGLRAIDSLLTVGEGQRMGIFAAAGGGKSTLLSMLCKGAQIEASEDGATDIDDAIESGFRDS